MITATDLFAGAGGSTEGLTQAGVRVEVCANHWPTAVATHALNHPDTEHRIKDLSEIDWRTFPSTDVLWASPSCFAAGALVMTARGQVPIEEVAIGDLVLTHRGRWRAVDNVMTKLADTIMVRGGGQHAIETTSEHPFYSKRRPYLSRERRRDNTVLPGWTSAGELTTDDYLATPEAVDPLPVPPIGGRGITDLGPAFWWLVGRWLGDGWVRLEETEGTDVPARTRTPYQPAGSPCVVCGEPAKINGNSPRFASPYCSRKCKSEATARNTARSRGWVSICCAKDEYDEVRERLAALPELTWWERENRTTWVFTTSHIGLTRWLTAEFGRYAHGKHLPAWLFGMPRDDRQALLNGFVAADGCVRRVTQIGTASQALAVDLRVLATTLGHIATASKPLARTSGAIEGRTVNMRPLHTVQWATAPDPRKARTYADGLHRWHAVRTVEPGRTGITVYNLSVEDDESYVVDGLVVHNCVWHARSGGRKALPVEDELARADPGAIDRATALAVIAAAEVHQYPVVLVENVIEFAKWVLFPWWLDGLRALGYRVGVRVLNAADYGEAQDRRRLFIVATLPGVDLDLTPPTMARRSASSILDPALGRPMTRRMYITPQVEEIPADLDGVPHLVMMRKHAHARRADRHPIATVTAGGNHHMLATLVDGIPHARLLTNRERARGQGFPDSFEFTGTAEDVVKQIGNAVPVGIARWLGERAMAALGGQAMLEVAA